MDYYKRFSELEKNYFDAYAYDTIWSLGYVYQSKYSFNQLNMKQIVDEIDFIGATVRIGISIHIVSMRIFREEFGI